MLAPLTLLWLDLQLGQATLLKEETARPQAGITLEVSPRPAGKVFAKAYDALSETPAVDPWLAHHRLAQQTRDGWSARAKTLYTAIEDLLTNPRPNEPVWKEDINPFAWLSLLRGKGGDWWREFCANPANDLKLNLMLPLRHDFSRGGSDRRVAARENNNGAIDAFVLDGDLAKAARLLNSASERDPTYALPMFNAGILQAVSHNWDYALNLFAGATKREPGSNLVEFMGRWAPELRKIKTLLTDRMGSQSRLYVEKVQEAVVMVQLGKYRSAISYAADAASLDDSRAGAYLVAALAAEVDGHGAEAFAIVQASLEFTVKDPHEARIEESVFKGLWGPPAP